MYEVDDSAFDSDSQESQYWKGFIYSDGHVAESVAGSARFIIGLGEKDISHLHLLRRFLKSTHPVRVFPPGRQSFGGPIAYFNARSNRLCASLIAAGVTTRRPLPPDHELAQSVHFWRGAIDGDGWIGVQRIKGRLYPYIGLSGRLPIIESFQSYLEENFSIVLKIIKTESTHKITASAGTAEVLVNAFYGSCNIALERKIVRAKQIISGNITMFPPYDEGQSARSLDKKIVSEILSEEE